MVTNQSMYDAMCEVYRKFLCGELVEVTRCKDCRWWEQEQPGMVYCPNTVGSWVEDDWYCKGGEKRDVENS